MTRLNETAVTAENAPVVRPDFTDRQRVLLDAMNFDYETGHSRTFHILDNHLPGDFVLSGNGDNIFRKGHTFRRHLIIESVYAGGGIRIDHPLFGPEYRAGKRGKKVAIRFCGYGADDNHKPAVPQNMHRKMLDAGIAWVCAWMGRTNSIQIDHKYGRAPLGGYEDPSNPHGYAPLCEAANQAKGKRCNKCELTGQRASLADTGRKICGEDFIVGDATYEPLLSCFGCPLYDMRMTNEMPDHPDMVFALRRAHAEMQKRDPADLPATSVAYRDLLVATAKADIARRDAVLLDATARTVPAIPVPPKAVRPKAAPRKNPLARCMRLIVRQLERL